MLVLTSGLRRSPQNEWITLPPHTSFKICWKMLHFQFMSKAQFTNIIMQKKNLLCFCVDGELFYSIFHFYVPSSLWKSLKNKQHQNSVVPFPGLAVACTSWFTSAASLPSLFTPFLSAGSKICSSIIKRTLPQTY